MLMKLTLIMNPEDCETPSSFIKEICNGDEQPSDVLGHKWNHEKDTLAVSRGVDRPLDKAITHQTFSSFFFFLRLTLWY